MFLRNIIRNSRRLSNFSWALRGLFGVTRQSIHEKYFIKKTKHIIPDYLATHEIKKLQIGGGNNILNGWLNVNIYCGDRVDGKEELKQAFMDATRPFPFKDGTFNYIFSEHMIEHISYKDADFMIQESSRVLCCGGKIRIATPGYDNLLKLVDAHSKESVEKYFKKLISPHYGPDIPLDSSYVINYMFYNYGHKFIHSKVTLTHLLNKYGFTDVQFLKPQESSDVNFRNIEINFMATGKENNEMETLVVEAIRK